MLIDCHTHWGTEWLERDGRDPTTWLKILDEHGVTHAAVLPGLGLFDAGRLAEDNDNVAAVCARSNGRMIPFCSVNIWLRDEALAELRRCLEQLRFRGIKFHPWLQGCSVSNPVMDEVCETAGVFDVPILFHDGTPPFSLPSQIALLAKRHPQTQIILGHSGLFEHWREAAAAMNTADNLWGCLCSPHVAGLKGLVARCDPSRLLWGSDQGYALADCYNYRLPLMDQVGLSAAQRQAMLTDNPARLLKLDRELT
jgi:predicted TIM-barrel fold metal-dependent hydrolase